MKKILALIFLSIPLSLVAKIWNPESLPMVHLQDKYRYVCNPDSILNKETVAYCDSLIYVLEQKTGAQFVVVVVEHIEGDDPYEFNKKLFLKYKFGQADVDNGLLLTLASKDRSYFFSTGKGMEGVLPDALVKRMENTIFVPKLKEEDWNGGISDMVTMTCQYLLGNDTIRAEIESKVNPVKSHAKSSGGNKTSSGETLFIILTACVLFAIGLRKSYTSKRKPCPRCKSKYGMLKTDEKRFSNGDMVQVHQVWTCAKCGWGELKDSAYQEVHYVSSGGSDDYDSDSSDSYSSYDDDSDSGGSFGGGDYGGGGAGGRF